MSNQPVRTLEKPKPTRRTCQQTTHKPPVLGRQATPSEPQTSLPEPTPEEASRFLQGYLYLELYSYHEQILFVLKFIYMYVRYDGNIEIIDVSDQQFIRR